MASIATYLNKAPNQVVDVPAGTYTGASGVFNGSAPSGGTYSGWLILRAPSKGAVVVQSLTTANQLNIQSGSKKILFIGFEFQGVANCDGTDIRFWYCEHWIPNVNRSDLNSYGPFNQPTPLIARSSNRVELYGCDIHEASDTSVLGGAQNALYRAVHVYNSVPSNGSRWHSDAPEINVNNPITRTTSVTLDQCDIDTTFGGGRAGGGVEVEAHDAGNINVTVKDSWVHGSTDTGINLQAGSSKTVNLTLQGTVRIWNYNNQNAIVSNGSGVAAARVLTVPDRRTNSDPNLVIDPTGVKDSTAGLQAWLDAQPPGTSDSDRTYIDFGSGTTYRCNGQLTMTRAWTSWLSDSNDRATLRQDDPYPFYIRPATSNYKGDMAIPQTYIDGDERSIGWGTTYSGNTITRTDRGWFISNWQSGQTYQAPVTNYDGRTAYRKVISGGNVYRCTTAHTSSAGNAPGVAGAPWVLLGSNTGFQDSNTIEVWYFTINGGTVGSNDPWASELYLIDSVSADGKSLTVQGTLHASDETDPSANTHRFWATVPRGDWERYFRPNPSAPVSGASGPKAFTGSYPGGTAAAVAMVGTGGGGNPELSAKFQVVLGAQHCVLSYLKIHGSNDNWRTRVDNSPVNAPTQSESNFTVVYQQSFGEVHHCDIWETWSTGLEMNGFRLSAHHNLIYRNGFQNMYSNRSYQCAFNYNTCHSSHGSTIDFEPNDERATSLISGSTWPIQEWVVRGNIFGQALSGGRTGFAGSSNFGISRFKIEDNQSLNADVSSGAIPDTVAIDTSSAMGPTELTNANRTIPCGNFWWRNNRTDAAQDAVTFRFMRNVLCEGNDRQSKDNGDGFLDAHNTVTNRMSRNNTVNGAADPGGEGFQYEGGTTSSSPFIEPGQGGSGDSWWDAGCPDPPVPGL